MDEPIPARFEGRVPLAIGGSYWVGAIFGSALSLVLLNDAIIDQFHGRRLAFGLGAFLGVCILLIRRYIPEGSRWLATHGRKTGRRAFAEDPYPTRSSP